MSKGLPEKMILIGRLMRQIKTKYKLMNKIVFLILFMGLISCSKFQEKIIPESKSQLASGQLPEPPKSTHNESLQLGPELAKYVIFLAVDGMGSTRFLEANIPNMKKLMEEGAYTLENRAVIPSVSYPNWASMFMGAGPDVHGYINNTSEPTVPSAEITYNGIFPTIYFILKDQRPDQTTALVAEWNGVVACVDRKALDIYYDTATGGGHLKNKAIEIIAAGCPNFFTIAWDVLDGTGHGFGWWSPNYFQVLTKIDSEMGEIIQAVKDAGIYDETIFVVSSDHGGVGTSHGGYTEEHRYTPYIICGPNIKKDHLVKETTMKYDLAPNFAYMFGLTCPNVWRGKVIEDFFAVQN